jgi:integrase
MASIEKRMRNGQVRWYCRYRDPAGRQRASAFDRRVDAEKFLISIEASKMKGAYVDPKEMAQPFRVVAEAHFDAHKHNLAADTTRLLKRSRLDRHILPVLGDMSIGTIRPSTMSAAVATWSTTLKPGTVGQILRQVRQIFDAAVLDGTVSSNPAKAVKPPTPPRRRAVNLSDDDIKAALAATSAEYRSLMITLVGLGLRVSEACGLRVVDVDFLRKTVKVRQQRRPGGDMGKLKTSSSSRDIPAVDTVTAAIAEQIRLYPRTDGLVFSSSTGRALTKAIAGHVFSDISTKSKVKMSPHSARHYFGASLISQGVSVVAVSEWLGHSSPEITYRGYSYLMTNDHEVGRAAMTATMGKLIPDVYPACTDEAVGGS